MTRAIILVALAGCAAARADEPPAKQRSLAAWAEVYRVLQHPRCRNCHPAGDAPLQFDVGRRHAQNITRRSTQNGLPCASCHRNKNAALRGGPPGAPNWHLPPAEHPMVFEGRTSAALCAQVKDPAQNGGKNHAQLIEHAEDSLVKWAWDPGPGRTKPPITHDAFAAAMRTWIENGAACP